jgi:hypothetical protein
MEESTRFLNEKISKMKQGILIILIGLFSLFSQAQTDGNERNKGKIGVAINSSMNGEVYPIRLVPSITYIRGKSQFELGLGIHPFIRKDQNIFSGEFNYKYFPNGTEKKFNMYVIGRFSYIHNPRKTYYPTTYDYLFLNGGYGFQLTPFKNAYIGTNFTAGTYTYNKRTEAEIPGVVEKHLFDSFGFNLAFQFNIGYRF